MCGQWQPDKTSQLQLITWATSFHDSDFSSKVGGGLPWSPPHSLFFSSQHSLTPEMTLPVCFLLCASPLRIEGPWGQKPCLSDPRLPLQNYPEQRVAYSKHFVNMCRVNQWMNQGTGPGASFLEAMDKEGSPPTLVSELWIALSELWPMEPCDTDHPEQPAMPSNDKEVTEPPTRITRLETWETTASRSFKNRQEAPPMEEKSHLWRNGCNPEDPHH